jgi:DNA-binding IclR family transcriptional regulator
VKDQIMQALAATNGGPGLTSEELVGKLGMPRALVRQELARLVFDEQLVTCHVDGRYKIGDPASILVVA